MFNQRTPSAKKSKTIAFTCPKQFSAINTNENGFSPKLNKSQVKTPSNKSSGIKFIQSNVKNIEKAHENTYFANLVKQSASKTSLPGSLKPNQLKISFKPNKNYCLQSPNAKFLIDSQKDKGYSNIMDKVNNLNQKLEQNKAKKSIYYGLDLAKYMIKSSERSITSPNNNRNNLTSPKLIQIKQALSSYIDSKISENKNNNNEKPEINHQKLEINHDKLDINPRIHKVEDFSSQERENVPTITLDSLIDLDNNNNNNRKATSYMCLEELQVKTELQFEKNEDHHGLNHQLNNEKPLGKKAIVASSCPEIDNYETHNIDILPDLEPLPQGRNEIKYNEIIDEKYEPNGHLIDEKATTNTTNNSINIAKPIVLDLQEANTEVSRNTENATDHKNEKEIVNEKINNNEEESKSEIELAIENNNINSQEQSNDDSDKTQTKKKKVFIVPIYKKSRFYQEHQYISSKTEIPNEEPQENGKNINEENQYQQKQ